MFILREEWPTSRFGTLGFVFQLRSRKCRHQSSMSLSAAFESAAFGLYLQVYMYFQGMMAFYSPKKKKQVSHFYPLCLTPAFFFFFFRLCKSFVNL